MFSLLSRFPLLRRLTLTLFAFSLVTTVVVSAITWSVEYRHELQLLHHQLDQLPQSHLPALVNNLWTLNYPAVTLQLQAILTLPDVDVAELRTSDGRRFRYALPHQPPAAQAIVKKYPLRYRDRNTDSLLGTLVVTADPRHLRQRMLKKAPAIVAASFLEIVLICGFALFLFLRLFNRHLNRIVGYADQLDLDRLDRPLALPEKRPRPGRPDELDRLIQAINAMRQRLREGIHRRRQTEQALANEKERLAVTLRSIGEGVITTDVTSHVVLVNRTAEELTGWSQEEAIGRPLAEVLPLFHAGSGEPRENPVKELVGAAGKPTPRTCPFLLRARDGNERLIVINTAPIRDRQSTVMGMVLVCRDITEQQRLEEEAIKAKKLESVGQLAGGIAHDFNNLLAGIIGNLDLALLASRPGDPAHEQLLAAEKAAVRARDLTHQLLTFAKGGEPVRRLTSVAEVIRDSADFILRGSPIQCRYRIADDLWEAEVDAGQISQVIQNIVLNAKQVMAAGGEILVSAENLAVAPGSFPGLDGGPYLKITIEDQGPGIPPSILEKIFDPYFTTREEGSGLGLAITHSIVHKHRGWITVASTPGAGSRFTILLPATGRQTTSRQPRTEKPARGRGRILIMDDDPMVRQVASEMLRRLGYQVLTADNGEEALTLYQHHQEAGTPVDLVIMDLTVPGGMGGREAIKRLLAMDPNARAIVASGYSTDPVMARFREYGFIGAITKPFLTSDLSRTIAMALASR